MRDWLEIIRRLTWLLPSTRRRYPGTPRPWTRCHCGALADVRPLAGSPMCWPCKYAGHPTCECSDPETWEANTPADREDRS